jgi:hypothetical protein
MSKLVLYFIIFIFAHCVFLSYGFWIARYTDRMELFGHHFSSVWAFWLAVLVVATPLLHTANLVLSGTFYFGYKEFKSGWMVLLTFIGAQVIAYPAMTYFWFKEAPNKGTFIGASMAMAGMLVAYFWRK